MPDTAARIPSAVHHVADMLHAAIQRQYPGARTVDQRVAELAVVALMAAREALAQDIEDVAEGVDGVDNDIRQRGWRDGLLHATSIVRGGKSAPQLREFWGRFPLATTLWLRERLCQYREKRASDARTSSGQPR